MFSRPLFGETKNHSEGGESILGHIRANYFAHELNVAKITINDFSFKERLKK